MCCSRRLVPWIPLSSITIASWCCTYTHCCDTHVPPTIQLLEPTFESMFVSCCTSWCTNVAVDVICLGKNDNICQVLNERRSEATEVTPEAYDALVGTLRVFLDGCGPSSPATPTPTTLAETPMPSDTGGRSSPSVSPSPGSLAGAFVGPPATRRTRRKSLSFVSLILISISVLIYECRTCYLGWCTHLYRKM